MELISDGEYKIYHNHRAEPYFTFVKNGLKTIEGRIRKGWYKHVRQGDHIVIYNEEETEHIKVRVREVRNYSFLKEMLENEPLKKILPDAESINQGLKIYERFYSPEQEKEFGVVAIEIEKI